MEITFKNVEEFKIALEAGKIKTPQFISIRNYENQKHEVSNYLLNLGVHYGRVLQKDLAVFNFMNPSDFVLPERLEYIRNEAYEEALSSLTANTDKNVDNRTPASRRNLENFETVTPNIKVLKRTGEMYLVGMIIRKTLITPGVYKERKSKDMTIAKAIMTKHFESNNYRMFFLSKITSIKINGVNMVINN